jgi:TolB-like protein/Tfp pilus assembly protein PilF
MKRCPECRRDYYDDSLLYCLDDGSSLLDGPARESLSPPPNSADASYDEPRTAILRESSASEDEPTALFVKAGKDRLKVENSIAVLPFANMSADAENEYFCDGLAEEILNALARVDRLKVAARTSAFSFKGRDANVSQIAAALNVNTVLEGGVRKSNDRLRITAQLINAADGYHLWSERYDKDLKDIFDVQDEIAFAVVEALKIKLLGEEKAAILKRPTQDPEAYEYYLRGQSHFYRWTPVDFQKAVENFERAVLIDPNYASAFAGMADAYTELSFFSFAPVNARKKASEAANKALQLDDGLAEAHVSQGLIKLYFDWDYPGAESEFKKAIALSPGGSYVRLWYGWFLGLMGRFDESLRELQATRELDPLSAPGINGIGIVHLWGGDTDAAIKVFQELLDLYPDYVIALSFLAEAYAQKNDIDSALRTIGKIPPEATDPQALSIRGYIYARSGDRETAKNILTEFAERSNHEYVPALNFAQIYAGLGDREQVFAWLEKAYEERAIWIPFLKVDVKFEPFRSNPRFQELLRKVGFAE